MGEWTFFIGIGVLLSVIGQGAGCAARQPSRIPIPEIDNEIESLAWHFGILLSNIELPKISHLTVKVEVAKGQPNMEKVAGPLVQGYNLKGKKFASLITPGSSFQEFNGREGAFTLTVYYQQLSSLVSFFKPKRTRMVVSVWWNSIDETPLEITGEWNGRGFIKAIGTCKFRSDVVMMANLSIFRTTYDQASKDALLTKLEESIPMTYVNFCIPETTAQSVYGVISSSPNPMPLEVFSLPEFVLFASFPDLDNRK